MIDIQIDFDDQKLQTLLQQSKINYIAEVGVFDATNAKKGATHEFGSVSNNIPKRSWLKMPLETYSSELLETAKNIVNNNLEQGEANSKEVATALGITAENIIQNAFATGGFSKWAKLSAKTIKLKGHDTILIDKAELVNAIQSKVKKV